MSRTRDGSSLQDQECRRDAGIRISTLPRLCFLLRGVALFKPSPNRHRDAVQLMTLLHFTTSQQPYKLRFKNTISLSYPPWKALRRASEETIRIVHPHRTRGKYKCNGSRHVQAFLGQARSADAPLTREARWQHIKYTALLIGGNIGPAFLPV